MTVSPTKRAGSVTFVVGAGASNSVSYSKETDVLSPLDRDFFDLLQRLEAQEKDEPAVNWVLTRMSTLPFEYRRSLERTFYTLHLRSYLGRKLAGADEREEEAVAGNFARSNSSVTPKGSRRPLADFTILIAIRPPPVLIARILGARS